MDPSLAFVSLSSQPVQLTERVALLPGAFTPLALPLEWLPPDLRARWLLAHAEAPLAARIAAALEAGMVDEAWAALAPRTEPIAGDVALEAALARWAAAEGARLHLAPAALAVLAAEPAHQAVVQSARSALDDVAELAAPLGWPRWVGTVTVVMGDVDTPILPRGHDLLARPALPAVRVAADQPVRPATARGLMLLTLRRCAPPAAGWPAWLEDGLAGVAEATAANGAGPSPIRMLAARQQAGPQAILRLLRGDLRDPALALAVCAPLAHSKRRHLLPNLLDGLRNGIDGPAAVKLAYGLTPERLAAER